MPEITVSRRAEIAREAANILLDTRSVLFNAREPFVYTSGKTGPVYVDIRRLISFPRERGVLMDFAVEILEADIGARNIDYVAGGETAGIPYAAFVAERMGKPMLYIRKKPKGFGRNAQIEGCLEGSAPKVVLIEDLQTDGGSKKVFIDALRAAEAVVAHSFVVFHYGIFPRSDENMKEMGVRLHALATWRDVLEAARARQFFDATTLAEVESFLSDPAAWQDSHPPQSGGKAAG